MHIVFLELVIDPSCTLIFEAEAAEPNVMKRPPRNPKEGLLSLETVVFSVLQGASALGVCLGVFLLSRPTHGTDAARALTFATLVVAFLVIILANRSWTRTIVGMLHVRNSALPWVIGGTAALLASVLLVPGLRGVFHFAPLHPADLALSLGAGAVCVMWFELLKVAKWRGRIGSGGSPARADE